MQIAPVAQDRIAENSAASWVIPLFLLAIHAPSLALGGNRFGFILPTAAIVFALLATRAASLSPPRYASWLWLGVIAWGGAHIAFGLTPDQGEAGQILARLALYGAIYLIAAEMGRSWRLAILLVKATAMWIALVSTFGLIAWVTGDNPVLAELEAYPRPLEATFINRNAFALYAVFGFLTALSVCFMTCRDLASFVSGGWIWLAAAALSVAALMLTESRGGLGAGFIGLATFCVMMSKWRWLLFLTGAFLILGSLMSGAFLRDGVLLEDARFSVHLRIFQQTANAPLTGHGLGAFQDTFRAALGADWRWGDWDHAHQQYLETAYELGWPAAFALFAAIALAAPRPKRRDPVCAMAIACLCAAAAQALVDFSLTIPSVAMTLALILGVARGRAEGGR